MNAVLNRIISLPKVLLHDHLDGGVRPATLVELAAEVGYTLPFSDPDALAAWFVRTASGNSLEMYLETFAHTVALMQTPEQLHRVARELVLDLAADGVVYSEQRYAPEQHLRNGLSLQQVVDAVQKGIAEGVAEAAARQQVIRVGTILSAMRQADRADVIAALAIANRDNGVVGFDLAGPEAGFPPSRHLSAFRTLRDANMPVTVHAGEGAGLDSMAEAVHQAGALRLGHGVRIMEDITFLPTHEPMPWAERFPPAQLGPLANWIRDRRILLELAPSSNLQTGAATSIAAHPVTALKNLDFAVSVNTDNRLQSGTTLSREFALLVEHAGWTIEDILRVTVSAAQHAFIHQNERVDLIDRVIVPAFAPQTPGGHFV